MDVTSIVNGILATQDETRQLQLATAVLRPSAHLQKVAAQVLAGEASPADLSPGVGGNVDVTA